MCNHRECAEYFKAQPAYHRCFEVLRKKWISYGKVQGNILLKQTSEEERRAVGGIIGKVFYEDSIRFTFQEFEQGLQKTRFAPVDIKGVLEEYFGEPLLTTRNRQREAEEKKICFLGRLCEYFEENVGRGSVMCQWMEALISEKKYGYQLLVREYGKNEKLAEGLVQHVGKAMLKLEALRDIGEEYPLAVLAAEITGNPHYFDRNTVAGQLLVCGICYREKMEYPQNAHQWRELLMQTSIVPDNISSMIHAYGLHLLTNQGWHGAYESFCQRGEPCVITMENMKGIIGARAQGRQVYIIENEMVFSYLTHHLDSSETTILCTSGQPRSVAQVLISCILSSGAEIYYNGDIDPDGICIADRLWKKFGESFHIWRMSPEDYERSLSKEIIGAAGRTKLEHISHPVLRNTAECMKKKQLAGYQENMLEVLLEDMRRGTICSQMR